MKFNPRWIIGKTIARVEMNPLANSSSANRTTHKPCIWFTDGSHISFFTEESEDASFYGTNILYTKSPKGAQQ